MPSASSPEAFRPNCPIFCLAFPFAWRSLPRRRVFVLPFIRCSLVGFWNHPKFPLPSRLTASLSGMKKSGARGASPGELDCAGLRVQLLAPDGDRIGDSIVGVEAVPIRLESGVLGAGLLRAV